MWNSGVWTICVCCCLFVCLFVAWSWLIVPDCRIVDEFVQNVAKELEAIFRSMTLGRPKCLGIDGTKVTCVGIRHNPFKWYKTMEMRRARIFFFWHFSYPNSSCLVASNYAFLFQSIDISKQGLEVDFSRHLKRNHKLMWHSSDFCTVTAVR